MVVGVVVAVLALVAAMHVGTTAVVRWSDDRAVRDPVTPRCVSDEHGLALADVVPGWSWLARRGRCRTCGARIPTALPVVEVALVVVLVAVAWRHPGPVLVLLAPVAWSAVVATPIDLAHHIIPDRLTYPLALWSVVAVTLLAALDGTWGDWRRAVLVGIVLPVGMELFSLAFVLLRGVRGMGRGDVKWAVSLGVATGWLGPWAVLALLAGTILTSGVVSVGLLAMGRAASARIPYGPFLAVGTIVALVTPAEVVQRVLS